MPATDTNKPTSTKVPAKVHKNSKINFDEAIKLRQRGWTYKEIADKYGVTESAAHQRISMYSPDPAELKAFRDKEGDIWTGVKSRILKHVTDEKLEECSAYQLLGMAGIANQNSRLVEGNSTANVQTIVTDLIGELNDEE